MGPGMSAPPTPKSAIRDARSEVLGARRVAYNLEPLNAEDVEDLALVVDQLATAVHVGTAAQLTLCSAADRVPDEGPRR
jgi:hypothetical protein